MYCPPVQYPTMQMQMRMQQQQQQQGRGGQGGYSGGRGRGNNGWQGTWGHMQQQHTPMQPNANYGNSGSQKNLYCIYSNYNYCHTDGVHVYDNHTSATCKTPDPHHNRNATRQNPIGGSVRGIHKTVMSEQYGREASHNPQHNPTQGYLSWSASGFQGTRRQHEMEEGGSSNNSIKGKTSCTQT
jgi:hypothetical protein